MTRTLRYRIFSAYGGALLISALAILARWLLDPFLRDALPTTTVILAVILTVWRAGAGPAVLAAVAGYVAAYILFLPPRGELTLKGPTEWMRVASYCLTSGGIIIFGSLMRSSRQGAETALGEMLGQKERLEREMAEHRLAEAELRNQKERYRVTFTSIGDAVIATDTLGKVNFANPVAESLTGWSNEEAQGRSLTDVFRMVNEDTGEPLEDPVRKCLDAGESVSLGNHIVLIARDGTARSIDHSASPIRDGEGHLSGVVLIFRDITEVRRAQAARFRLAALVESSEDAIYSKTLDGIITSWNVSAERLYGWTAEEIVGRSVSLLVPDERKGELAMIMDTIRRGGRTGILETARRRKDGSMVDVSVSISAIKDSSGTVIGASSITRDITERLKLEASARKQAELLVEADQRKDEFLAVLAHELRNPLAPIRYALEIMRRAPRDQHLVEQATRTLERQVQQVVRLVDDLLDVSRVSRGKITLRPERISLETVVRRALETSWPLIEQRGHQVEMTMPPGPLFVEADPTRLAQVFANLLNNASKFTEQGGRIWIRAERRGEQAAVSIRDNGIGISVQALPRIFDMFSQADRSMERSAGGLGIGLSLVRALVELHGGTVSAHSEGPGRGSEFVVHLPVAPDHGPVRAEDLPHSARMAVARRILVVDDNRDSADSLSRMLGLMGHEIRTAYDGFEALRAYTEFRPEVVILDIGLPGLNGYEAARRLRSLAGGNKLMLVAATGWGQNEDKERARRAGFDAHMTKPVEPRALEALLLERMGS